MKQFIQILSHCNDMITPNHCNWDTALTPHSPSGGERGSATSPGRCVPAAAPQSLARTLWAGRRWRRSLGKLPDWTPAPLRLGEPSAGQWLFFAVDYIKGNGHHYNSLTKENLIDKLWLWQKRCMIINMAVYWGDNVVLEWRQWHESDGLLDYKKVMKTMVCWLVWWRGCDALEVMCHYVPTWNTLFDTFPLMVVSFHWF